MKYSHSSTLHKGLIGMVILSLCLLPLLGLHIHLPETHMGTGLHSHHAETHGFHLHTSQHDNIDTETAHQSDTQQIELDTDTYQAKIFKLLAFVALTCIFLGGFVTTSTIIRPHYIPPFQNPFEVFRAMRRGPPLV